MPDGFGLKNRERCKKEKLLIWREKWAEVSNRKFEEKGLKECIDHAPIRIGALTKSRLYIWCMKPQNWRKKANGASRVI